MQARSGPHTSTVYAVAGTVMVLAAFASLWARGRSWEVQYGLFAFHNGPPALLLLWLGRLVAIRQPGNRIGPLLQVTAALGAAHVAVAAVADAALVDFGYTAPIAEDHPLVPAELPLGASVPLWIMNWLWVPQVVLLVAVLPLVFPDGRLPGRRWRAGPWLAAAATVALVGSMAIDAWPTSTFVTGSPPHPGILAGLAVGGLLLAAASLTAFAGLLVRWRGVAAAERGPFRLVGSTAGVLAVVMIATYPWQQVWIPAGLVSIYVLLTAYALAAARFRVHELEPVLSRGAVAGALSLAATAALAGVVLAVGLATAAATDNSVVPFVAVALVAVAAEPLRRAFRRLVDRVVFRLAADRAQVVSTVAERVSHGPEPVELMDDVVESLHRGTGATRVEAWLADGSADVLAVARGAPRSGAPVLAEPITSHGERLGELRVFAVVPGDLVPGAGRLVTEVAQVCGTALRSTRLATELERQVRELQLSRRRLVEAQETARRRIERDLHDGAQAQLIALRLRLAYLQESAGLQEPELAGQLADLATALDGAVDTLRDLARGLAPPLLEQAGVAAALRALTRGLPLPVQVEPDGIGRYDPAVESAVYFACLEGIQNALRHSAASRMEVRLSATADTVSFTVLDDGCGFDSSASRPGSGLANVADRLQALGGRLTLESRPGGGTRFTGTVRAFTHAP